MSSITVPVGPFEASFNLTASQFFVGESLYIPFVDYDHGVMDGSLYVLDNQLNAVFSLGSIISYPQGFVLNPSVPWNEQWPYAPQDYVGYTNLAHIATPEPGTFWLVFVPLLVAFLSVRSCKLLRGFLRAALPAMRGSSTMSR